MTSDEDSLIAAEADFNRAMISNDPAEIRRCISPHWVLVTPERGPIPGSDVLEAIERGILVHDTMSKQHDVVRVLGNTGFVTGRGRNTGWFHGAPISADEWITDVYSRVDGCWVCELTHLTPAPSDA